MLLIYGLLQFHTMFVRPFIPLKIQTSVTINTQIITVSLTVPEPSDNKPEQTMLYGQFVVLLFVKLFKKSMRPLVFLSILHNIHCELRNLQASQSHL